MSGMQTLYEMSDELLAIDALLLETGGEWNDTLQARIDAVDLQLAEKVDGYASYMRAREAFAKACEAEADVLNNKARIARNTVDRMKARALEVCERLGLAELTGKIWKLCRTVNGGRQSVRLTEPDLAKLPVQFVVTRPLVDADALRDALERRDPAALAVAELAPRGSHIRVR